MRLFLDTNVITEFLFNRTYVNEAAEIIARIENGEYQGFISTGSFYTLTYLIDTYLKRQGMTNPIRLEKQREILEKLLYQFSVVDISNNELRNGIRNLVYTDLEDSYQLMAAVKGNCDYLITINTKDFPDSEYSVKVISPVDFIHNR